MGFKLYKDNRKCYLIKIIYKDLQVGERYIHDTQKVSEILQELCDDDSVYDFKVFERLAVDYE